MRKLVFLFLIVLTLPVSAQFALKGGVTIADKELRNAAVTGQYYYQCLAISGDLYIPTAKSAKVAGGGRIGLNLGNYGFRIVGDIGGIYDDDTWNALAGIELNIRLGGPVGMFGRFQRTFPILRDRYDESTKIHWDRGRSDFQVGITIDLVSGRCRWCLPFFLKSFLDTGSFLSVR